MREVVVVGLAEHEEAVRVLFELAQGRFTPLQEIAPWVPAALGAAVTHALQVRPQDRYASAKAFSRELAVYLHRAAPATSESTVAGVMAWLFAREAFKGHLHTLFNYEAGQVALADALAVGSAAHNLVFLGDPNQLPQVSQGAQPEEAKVSVLQHLLGDAETVPPERGIFLAETWRLRPEVSTYRSTAAESNEPKKRNGAASRTMETAMRAIS